MDNYKWEVYQTETFGDLLKNRKRADSKRFEKEMRLLKEFLNDLLLSLEMRKPVPERWNFHQLNNFRFKGRLYKNAYDAHLRGDLVLILQIDFDRKLIILLFIGSHSELFG